MELGSAYDIIWYDLHIGKKGECEAMKMDFIMKLIETAALPPSRYDPEIDGCAMQTRHHGPPISYFDDEERLLQALEARTLLRKVYFITSGSLGKEIVPKIGEAKLKVYEYYIFCGKMMEYTEWAQECREDGLRIKMFDFETDLLIRLARDISRELIKEGKQLLNSGHPQSALTYFKYARAIADRANDVETVRCRDPHNPSIEHKLQLDGEKGFIALAKKLCPKPPK